MSVFLIKQDDTRPHIELVLARDVDGVMTPADLSERGGVSAAYLILKEKGGGLVFKKAGIIDTPLEAGYFRYAWASGDTANAGKYSAEVEVVWADGTVESFPTVSTVPVTILEDAE